MKYNLSLDDRQGRGRGDQTCPLSRCMGWRLQAGEFVPKSPYTASTRSVLMKRWFGNTLDSKSERNVDKNSFL